MLPFVFTSFLVAMQLSSPSLASARRLLQDATLGTTASSDRLPPPLFPQMGSVGSDAGALAMNTLGAQLAEGARNLQAGISVLQEIDSAIHDLCVGDGILRNAHVCDGIRDAEGPTTAPPPAFQPLTTLAASVQPAPLTPMASETLGQFPVRLESQLAAICCILSSTFIVQLCGLAAAGLMFNVPGFELL